MPRPVTEKFPVTNGIAGDGLQKLRVAVVGDGFAKSRTRNLGSIQASDLQNWGGMAGLGRGFSVGLRLVCARAKRGFW